MGHGWLLYITGNHDRPTRPYMTPSTNRYTPQGNTTYTPRMQFSAQGPLTNCTCGLKRRSPTQSTMTNACSRRCYTLIYVVCTSNDTNLPPPCSSPLSGQMCPTRKPILSTTPTYEKLCELPANLTKFGSPYQYTPYANLGTKWPVVGVY